MKRAILLLLAIGLLAGCSAVSGSTETANVGMSDVSADLAVFEGNETYDVLATSPVEYSLTGSETYDTFFENAAVVYASVVTADGLIGVAETQLGAIATRLELAGSDDLAELANQLIETGELSPEDTAIINDVQTAANALVTSLESVPGNGQTLVEQIPDLVSSAPSEFATSPGTLTTVQDSLDTAQTNLTSAIEQAPDLATNLAGLAEALGGM